MRHRVAGRRLGRTGAHRVAMRRNLAQSLIEHETISTTIEKAKEIKPFVEKLITLAKKGKLEHRRRAISLLGNRAIVDYEDGQSKKQGTVVGKLFSEIGPRYLERPGGYTRIIRLSLRRLGDNGELVLIQLLGEDEPVKKERKPSTKRKAGKKAKATTKAKEKAQPVAASEEEAVAEATDATSGAGEESPADAVAVEPKPEDEETKT
jgi:large subunit ribosomal protein L17